MKNKLMNDEIVIPFSRIKILLIFLIVLVFVVAGIWLLSDAESIANGSYRRRNPDFIRILGIASVIFFGIGGILAFKKLFDKKKGLIINKNGIIDHSSGTSIGLIKWEDITGIGIVKIRSQKFVMIEVSNPEHYMSLNKNRLGKMTMRANYYKYGSPISISAITLKTNFKELLMTIQEKYEQHTAKYRL